MSAIIQALLPVFILIIIGLTIKRYRLIDNGIWVPAERITYYIFFPSLIISSAVRADLGGAGVWPMGFSLFSATFIVAMVALAMRKRLEISDRSFTSFFQGTFRPNTYVGIAVAFVLWGEIGVGLMAIAILAVVPLANLLAVSAMVRFGDSHDGARTPMRAFIAVVKNPLIIACVIGFGMNGFGLALPPVIEPLLDILGRAALPVSLLAVGAGLEFDALKQNASVSIQTTVIKLVALPAVALLIGRTMGVEGVSFTAMVLFASLSGSASSYVLAREMGGDGTLMAGIITATTIGAILTMPMWMWFAG
ncbi:MAG: AEC family transporter [Rhodospirillaceae bacterium]|nr:AEC family transporter [Rhodospirillaceae bacterium]